MKTNNKVNYREIDNVFLYEENPFPLLKRDNILPLNGKWKVKISKDISLNNINDDILIPFPIESKASMIEKRLNKNEYIIYKKEFKITDDFINDLTFIHFLGVDQKYKIILNDLEYDWVTPLNLPTKIDVSKSIKNDNVLYVIVMDNLDYVYPLGKQAKKPKGLFYTPFSGIYFPVFIESVNYGYIENIKLKTDLKGVNIDIISSSLNFDVEIKDMDTTIYQNKHNTLSFRIDIDNPKLWDINNPFLYKLIIKTDKDSIESYFGLRQIEMVDGFVYLNNKKIFINGVLDQGYYPEGISTPISYDDYEFDILAMKNLGFNTLRKHIKVEMPYFYYLCDKHGMLVLQDFVNNGKYSFFTLTALPTIGFKNRNDKKMNKNITQRSNFIAAGDGLIKSLENHPCILGYTIFNEGWGQFSSDKVYTLFKDNYNDILFDSTSGWFIKNKSDFNSLHLYFKNIDKLNKLDKVFISEFGALCYKDIDHAYSNKRVFGYKYFNSLDDVMNEFENLYINKILPYKDKLVGAIYTQLSDIEEEDNGILTYDRKKYKLDVNKVKQIMKKINEK